MSVDKMSRVELRAMAKSLGIKYGKLSLMQIRTAIQEHNPVDKKDKPKVRKERVGTKMSKCLALVAKKPDMPRKEMIAKFMDDIGLTKAGANTYVQLVRKKLNTK